MAGLGLSTEEIMEMALQHTGATKIPLDSGIHVPGDNIKRLLFAMDVNVGLLSMAKQMGFDAVVGHHPCGVLFHRGEVYRRHIDLLERHGILREKVEESLGAVIDTQVQRYENNRFRMLFYESPNQTILEVDAARLLGMPFINIHNLFDEMGRRILQEKIDKAFSCRPDWKLKEVLKLIESLPEAVMAKKQFGISPRIHMGSPDSLAAKTVFVHGALSAPSPPIIQFYWKHGFETVIVLHGDYDSLDRLKKEGGGHLILTGHFLGDSIGMTSFIRILRQRGLEVVCVGGIIDVETMD